MKKRIVAIAGGALLAATIAAQPAAAANYAYATQVDAYWNQTYSSLPATMNGGVGAALAGDFGLTVTFNIQSIRPAPGYTVIGSASGGPISNVNLNHQRGDNLTSQCWWTFTSDIGGPIPMNCAFTN